MSTINVNQLSGKLEADTVVDGNVHLLFELLIGLIVWNAKLEETGVCLGDTLHVVTVGPVH